MVRTKFFSGGDLETVAFTPDLAVGGTMSALLLLTQREILCAHEQRNESPRPLGCTSSLCVSSCPIHHYIDLASQSGVSIQLYQRTYNHLTVIDVALCA